MSDYIIHNGELYHFGVKGMKWGVRKEYYADKAKRKRLANEARKSGQWVNLYNKKARKDTLSTVRKVDRDLKKHNEISDKTKLAIERNVALQKDKAKAVKKLNSDIENLQRHVDGMISKYKDVKISDVRYAVKNGQKFVRGLRTDFDMSNFSIQKRSYVEPDGTKTTRYRPVETAYRYY